MTSNHFEAAAAQKLRWTERLLAGLSPANQTTARAFITRLQGQGKRSSHLFNVTIAMRKLDEGTHATPFKEVTPDQAASLLAEYSRVKSAASTKSLAVSLRSVLRFAHKGQLSPELFDALRYSVRMAPRDLKPLDKDEFKTLLATAAKTPHPITGLKHQALLWVLWDSGFRIGEVLSLTIGQVELDHKGGARLRLKPAREGLKTGTRTVYVVECVGPLDSWLGAHPRADEPDAPLFPNDRGHKYAFYWPQNINDLLNRLTRKAKLRHVTPHLFRHTRATRAARDGWNVPQLSAYFGWSVNSDMPGVYIHLSARDMEDKVRQDAGIDENGFRLSSAGMDEAALDKRLQQALRRLLSGTD